MNRQNISALLKKPEKKFTSNSGCEKGSVVILIFLFVTMGFTSCRDFFVSEVENIKFPGSESQLVVNIFISPQDSVIRVFVERSIPYVRKSNVATEPVGNTARVYIAAENTDYLQLSYDFDYKHYRISTRDFPVVENKKYRIRIETPKGEFARAECIIPAFRISDFEFSDLVYQQDQWGNNMAQFDWKFRANAASGSQFFRTGAYNVHYDVFSDGKGGKTIIGPQIMELWVDKGITLFADEKRGTYSFRAQYHGNPGSNKTFSARLASSNEGNSIVSVDSIFVYVIESDMNYYRYHKSINDYFYYGDDFPFSESVHIFTNIEGGLGIFGGYNIRRYLISTISK